MLPAALAIALAPALAACGGGDSGEAVERLAHQTGARTVAEAFRAALVARDLAPDQHADDVAVMRDVVEGLPGDPEIVGIEDADGDGRDDDHAAEVRVEAEAACVTVEPNGEIDVTGGAC